MFNSTRLPYFPLLCLLLFLKACAVLSWIIYGPIGLGPDEAQYWTWSQALDWGYYSKPPAIAWQIWLGTQLWGSTELGVRFFSVWLSFAQALVIYALARSCKLSEVAAFWCSIAMAFCPIGILGSWLAITDGGFLLCWTAACWALTHALSENKIPSPLVFGAWITVGALFKWPIYMLWLFYFYLRTRFFPTQTLSRLFAGIVVSLLGLAPSVWWNITHEWATFRHVGATLQGGSGAIRQGNMAEFIGSQMLLLSPLLFILLIAAYRVWWKNRRTLEPAIYSCGLISTGTLLYAICMSAWQKMQGNWAVMAYPTGIVLLGWYASQVVPQMWNWLKGGVVLAMGLSFVAFSLPFLPSSIVSTRLYPFKHNTGWPALAAALDAKGYDPAQHFLVSDKYQTTSILSFYNTGQKRAYFLNVQGIRKNQFCYWPGLQEEQKDKTGYFVYTETAPVLQKEGKTKWEDYQTKLEPYFEKVEFMGFSPLAYQGDRIMKGAFIFKCTQCTQKSPQDSTLY